MGRKLAIEATDIRECKYCGSQIVWAEAKSGKFYPVNYRPEHPEFVFGNDLHSKSCRRDDRDEPPASEPAALPALGRDDDMPF